MTIHPLKTHSTTTEQTPYLVGIDLGTTNSAVAYVDGRKERRTVQPFLIPQLTRLGFVDQRPALPSFCYLPLSGEFSNKQVQLPWTANRSYCVGEFAKEQGARTPSRLVTSAKSWLCHGGIDRRERVLPTLAEEPLRISPLEATRRYLVHIRDAWNHRMSRKNPEHELESQEVILTVPASFDEVARSLTAQAAHEAGLTRVTLLEEPLAAFYNWLRLNQDQWDTQLKAGEHILVCDVGGGTTDFTLIQVKEHHNSLSLERLSVGDHLLLGGDNFDNAIAHTLAQRLFPDGTDEIEPSQWLRLCHQARQAKETLLNDENPQEQVSITLQGTGSRLVGGSQSTILNRQEISDLLLNGFFGTYGREEALELRKRSGVTSVGLPYEPEASITKHLANFLFGATASEPHVFPDYVFFNGGSLKPKVLQKAILQSIEQWWPGKTPHILQSPNLDLSVSRGAAYYGLVRRGEGIRVGGGLARSYYLEIEMQDSSERKALTLLPRGSEEGTTFQSPHTFLLQANQPVSFTLLTSHVRLGDEPGQLIERNDEEMQSLPPLQTVLRYGKGSSNQIPVELHLQLTSVGTVALSLHAPDTGHSWNLDFQIRKASGQEDSLAAFVDGRQDEFLEQEKVEECLRILQNCFHEPDSRSTKKLMENLEAASELTRRDWPPSLLRTLADSALDHATLRHGTSALTRRWWNLTGFCLRPGRGYPLDDHRLQKLWKIILENLHEQPGTIETQLQRYICYRRIAPGLSKGQQTQIGSALHKIVQNARSKKRQQSGLQRYQTMEALRTLASLERLELKVKQSVGDTLLEYMEKDPSEEGLYWALGRVATRTPLYTSSAHVVPRKRCIQWVERLLHLATMPKLLLFPLSEMLRKTGFPDIDLPEELRQKAEQLWKDPNQQELFKQRISVAKSTDRAQQEASYGETLPPGLILTEETANNA